MMVATLLEEDLAGLSAAVQELDDAADVFEIRLDAQNHPVDPTAVRRLTTKPLVATCRRPRDGGKFQGEEHERLDLLERAAKAGFDYVDLEGALHVPVPEARVVRSRHDFHGAPRADELVRQALELAQGGAVAKIVANCQGLNDALEILTAQRRLRDANVPSSLMGMGEFPRGLAYLLGSRLVYGGGRTTAPGQPRLRDVRAQLDHWGSPEPARRLFLVVGDPVEHSLSPRMHNAAFRAHGVDAAYASLRVTSLEDLRRLVARAIDLGLEGLSVTAPLKQDAFEVVEECTAEADRANSVNCVAVRSGVPVGHNTDGLGAVQVLRRLLPASGGAVLVLGTGGAARGLLAHADQLPLSVAGRNPQKVHDLAEEFNVEGFPLEPAALRGADVIVNATAVDDPVLLDGYEGALFDLHYGAQPTAWERHARLHRLAFAGGRELLLEQGVLAFEFWTARAAPRDVMAATLGGTP